MEKQHLIKTINDKDYTDVAESSYQYQIHGFMPFNRKITNVLEMIRKYFQISEWQILDARLSMNGQYDSVMMDRLIDFRNQKGVDFTSLAELTLRTYDFTENEKKMFLMGKLDEVIWGIFVSIMDPNTYNNY